MKSKFFKILLSVVFGLAIFFGSFQVAQAVTNSQANYYGYQSRKVVQEALDKYPSIPAWKKTALMSKLSADGYFWMPTKLEKFNYIQKNLRANIYLSVVRQAENITRNSIDPKIVPYVSHKQASLYQKELLDSAQEGVDEWEGFYDRAIILYNKDIGPKPGRDVIPLEDKKYWARLDLDRLYIAYFPEKKANRSRPEFDSEESLWVSLRARGIRGERWSGKVYTSDELLMFIPIERVVAPLVKGVAGVVVKGVTKVGSKVVESGTFKVGTKVAGNKLTAIAGTKVYRFVASRIITITRPVIGTLNLDISKFFKYSGLSDTQMDRVVSTCVETLSSILKNPKLSKFLTKDEAKLILNNTSVYGPPRFNTQTGGLFTETELLSELAEWKIKGGSFYSHNMRILISEAYINGKTPIEIYMHEVFHWMSTKRNILMTAYSEKYFVDRLGYNPLEEGLTEFLSRNATSEITQKIITFNAYPNEVMVVKELYINLLQRWKNPEKAMDAMREIYFKDGIDVGIDKYFGEGAHQQISNFVRNGYYEKAADYIEKISF